MNTSGGVYVKVYGMICLKAVSLALDNFSLSVLAFS